MQSSLSAFPPLPLPGELRSKQLRCVRETCLLFPKNPESREDSRAFWDNTNNGAGMGGEKLLSACLHNYVNDEHLYMADSSIIHGLEALENSIQ